MASQKNLTGKVPREAIRTLEIPRLPHEIIAGFAKLVDLTGTVSDAMDNLGLAGAIPASVLAPTLPAKRIVGQAVTVRNVERQQSVFRSASEAINRMGETEAYNLADDAGVVFIPRQHAAAVLDESRKIDAGDSRRKQDIAAGANIAVLVQKKYK